MPAESCLYGKFTTESDVWAFGVVLWEIFTFGQQPYYGYSNTEVIEMVRQRQLLPCPANCPAHIYAMMRECWQEMPTTRPGFHDLHTRLRSWQAVHARDTTLAGGDDGGNYASAYQQPMAMTRPNNNQRNNYNASQGSSGGAVAYQTTMLTDHNSGANNVGASIPLPPPPTTLPPPPPPSHQQLAQHVFQLHRAAAAANGSSILPQSFHYQSGAATMNGSSSRPGTPSRTAAGNKGMPVMGHC